ncbi:hypothetical protein Vadar_002090 [Vaccinium darrowii]|uniref:Uncharacterized protein n=1 Tax=Vaccinium darrowii TaxID=229202 RepID=A0ACB7Y5V0_9ERIC|nr:hypothetical protein Vadar_002090 [Vaccinium darrowii]
MGGHAVDGCSEFMPAPSSNPTNPTMTTITTGLWSEFDFLEEEEEEEMEHGDCEKKKIKLAEIDEDEVENPNAVSNFRISAPLREVMKSKGIDVLQ